MKKTGLNIQIIAIAALGVATAFAQGLHITPVDTVFTDTTIAETRVTALSSLGDINGDGYEDLGVAFSSGWSTSMRLSSRVILYFGNAEGRFNNDWEYYFPAIDSEEWNSAVITMKRIGDVNNDGWDDMALGMPGYTWWGYCSGRAWIFYGEPGMDTIPDWQWTANHGVYYNYFGQEIHDAGDWNSDGYDDFVISAPWNDGGGEGDVYLILGGDPPDTSAYMSWHGTEMEEHLDCIGSADVDDDSKKELLFYNQTGYWDWTDTSRGDTLTMRLYKTNETTLDTLISKSFLFTDNYGCELAFYKPDSANFVYSFYWKPSLFLVPDSFFLFNFIWRDDSFHIEDLNLRDIIFCYDSNLIPLIVNINTIKDLNGDHQNEIIGELYYSERSWSDAFHWRAKGRFLILDPNDHLNLLYTSDSLFTHDAWNKPKMTTLDFNGDGKDEIFIGNTPFHDHEYGFIVFTTGDWESIEEQVEITNQNSLAGSFGNTIHFDLDMQGQAEISLYDITGRKIREKVIVVNKGRNSFSFGELNSGVYLYRIRFNGSEENLNGKLVYIR